MTDRGVIWSVAGAVAASGLARFGGPLWPAALEAAGRAADLAVQRLDLMTEAEEESAPAGLGRLAAAGRAALEADRAALPWPAGAWAGAPERAGPVAPEPPEALPLLVCTREGVVVRVVTGRRWAPRAPGSDA